MKRIALLSFSPVTIAGAAALLFFLQVAFAAAAPPRTTPEPAATAPNSVWMDVQDAYLAEFDKAFWVTPFDEVQVPFSLASPAPTGGVSVNTISSLSPGLSSVFFPAGQTHATRFEVFNPVPFVEIIPGWEVRSGYLAVNTASPPPGIDIVDPWVMTIVEVRESGSRNPRESVLCVICAAIKLLCFAVTGDSEGCITRGVACSDYVAPLSAGQEATRMFPPQGVAGDLGYSVMPVLRRYRDEVLSTTPEGLFYTDFYRTISPDMFLAILASPSLLVRLYHAQVAWTPGFQALIDGQGDTFTVTQPMEDDLLGIFATVESVGSPALAQALAFERTRLQLDQVAGLTMTGFQTQIETLGGTSAVEPMSWGRVKGLYR